MKDIFLISGLGADKRVFDFLDLREHKITHVEWINPLEDESIENYSKRLLPQIYSKKAILIGVSFGGLIAIEIGKLIAAEKVILISSAEDKGEIPLQSRWVGFFRLNKIIPSILFNKVNGMMFWFFGVEKESEKQLLRSIMEDTDPEFLKWGIDKLINWQNQTQLHNVTTIHGTKDRLFPGKKADFNIEGGGHLMIINRSMEISEIINGILK